MNKGLAAFLGFAVGGAAGVMASKQFFEEKYKRIADDEIDSVKAVFLKKKEKVQTKEEITPSLNPAKNEKAQYSHAVSNYSKKAEEPPEDEVVVSKEPQVIPPKLFCVNDNYEVVTLTYYADRVMADDADHEMSKEDIRASVGEDAVNHFGEYEPDSVHVRNDEKKCYYEILLSERTFDEVADEKPYLRR